jgi:hypothetical protein
MQDIDNKKYNKYLIKNNQNILLNNIKNKNFISWIIKKTQKYFNKDYINTREYGGIITMKDNNYDLIISPLFDPKSNDMIWPKDMIDNMDIDQILWHTHNIERGKKCEPPSGADFSVLLHVSLKNKFPFAISIHRDGIWIYKLNNHLNEEKKKVFKEYNNWVFWTMNAIATVFCSPKINTDDAEGENLKKFGITNMKTVEDYKNVINKVFDNHFFIDFIPFDKK